MAEIVMVMGESGSGKSASLRNFAPGEVCVLNVAGKRLPFKNKHAGNVVDNAGYAAIVKAIKENSHKRYVIDDSQYLMAFESFNRCEEVGYQKFTQMAKNFYSLLMYARKAPDDTIVYFLHHIDRDDAGVVKPKTQGRMLDEKLNVAGLFTTVLLAETDGKDHWFLTKNDGASVVKTPMGMFDDAKIPNDLKFVDDVIRAYYGMEE